MRFLFFNIVVGLALVYLYNGGQIDLSRFNSAFTSASPVLANTGSPGTKPSSGHARDVIEETLKPQENLPMSEPVKPENLRKFKTTPKSPTKSVGSSKSKGRSLPLIGESITIAKRANHKPVFGDTTPVEDPAIAQRRAEVLETSPRQPTSRKFSLKDGTALMSTAERRRSLDALVEEMEILYLEKVGG